MNLVCSSGNFTVQFTTEKPYKGHARDQPWGKALSFLWIRYPFKVEKVPRHGPGQLAVDVLAWARVLDQATSRGPFQPQPFRDSVKWSKFRLFPCKARLGISQYIFPSPTGTAEKTHCESRTHLATTGSSTLLEESLMFSARKHEVTQLFGNLHLIYRLNKSKNLNYLINKFWWQRLSFRKIELTFHTEA